MTQKPKDSFDVLNIGLGCGLLPGVLMKEGKINTIDIVEINHDIDHIHILVSIPPKLAVGKVIGIIKANTARMLKTKFPYIQKIYWGNDGIWSDGYFVSTVGINEEVVRKYIENQGKEDLGQAELELA